VKLRWVLLALVGATLVPVALVAAVVIWLAHQDARGDLERALLDQTRALAAAVDRQMETSIAALTMLATSEALDTGDLRRFYEQARRGRQTHPEWISVVLIDATGRPLLNLLEPLGTPLPSLASIEVFERTRRSLRPETSNLFFGPTSRRWLISVNVPLLRAGALRYVLTATITPDRFTSLLAAAQIPPDSVGTIIDRDGLVVARTRDQERRLGKPADPAYVALARERTDAVFRSHTLEGWDAYRAFSRAPRSQLTVDIAVPRERVDAPLRSWLWLLTGTTVAVFAASLSLALLLGRGMTHRMARLAAVLHAFARGERGPELPRFRVVELARVAHALADAMALLQARTEALRESERRYRDTFDRSPAGMFLTSEDGRVLDCNDAFARILGFPGRAEAQAANAREFYADPDERGRVLGRVRAEAALTGVEVQFRRHDGAPIWVLLNVVGLSDHSPARYEGSIVDITEQKRADELRSIARLANAAAHEINNPLTVVLGRLALLRENPAIGTETRAGIDQIEQAAARIRTIVADMQRLTRVELFQHTSGDMPEMIDIRRSSTPATPPSPSG
jgi:PAS domain S-box-containing protein